MKFSSAVEALRAQALRRPEVCAYTFLADGRSEERRLTYAELDRRARAIGAALRERGLQGERALLLYPPGLDFIAAFFGCLYAGAVAVPAYPPRSERFLGRLLSIVGDAAPRAVLTTPDLLAAAPRWTAAAPTLAELDWISTPDLAGGPELGDGPAPDPDTLAFLQYTSGSTASPKGVLVRHGHLVHNEEMIQRAFGQDEDSVVVGWLPLYHDMGLIGTVLQPLFSGARCVLMAPAAFLQQPARWLEAITRHRATTSGGPDFAYDLCVRRVNAEQRERLDLSSWRVAFNGAEPVRAATLERFARAFEPCGFRSDAFFPCYGLAEATLLVSARDSGRPPAPRHAAGSALERHRYEEAAPGAPGVRPLLPSGRPAAELRIEIVDPETGAPRSPGEIGEIWVSGPSVAGGYWQRPEETERTFGARLPDGSGPFLRTGDLGLLLDGDLFVTGRLKDLLILRGRNHYPQDLEVTAQASHPALQPGGGAAFSVDRDGAERLVIVHELEPRAARRADPAEVAEAIRLAIAAEHELRVHEVVLLRAGTLPRTSSGKVQRHACRAAWLDGSLEAVGRSVAEGVAEAAPETADGEERRRVELWLRERAARALDMPAAAIPVDRPLAALGLDSLAAIELAGAAEAELGFALPVDALLEGGTLASLADAVLAAGALAALATDTVVPESGTVGDHSPTPGQRGLWLHDRLAPAAALYNLAGAARVLGPVDAAALRRALQALADRHPALRTTFPAVDGEPVQRVHERLEIGFEERDVPDWNEERLAVALEEEAYRPFDVEAGPLLRAVLWTVPDGKVLSFTVHHLVADFVSLAVLARELGVLYGRPDAALPPPGLAPAAWARRQRERLAGEEGERLRRHWLGRLAGEPRGPREPLDLPADRPRPAVPSYRGAAAPLRLDAELTAALQGAGRAAGATLAATLLAAFQTLLHRYTAQDEIRVGCPASGRPRAEVAETVGYFANPLALRAEFGADPSFRDLLAAARAELAAGLAHQELPFPVLAAWLEPARDSSRTPVFQAMLVFHRGTAGEAAALASFALGEAGARMNLGGLEIESLALPERRAPFDLTLTVAERGGAIGASLQYAEDLFDAATARRMLGHFETLLRGIAADPGERVSHLPLLAAAEREQVLGAWAWGGDLPPLQAQALHAPFEAWARQAPDAPAIYFGHEVVTYGELDRRAEALARQIGPRSPEDRIAVCLERSPDLIAALLGVLKAGGVYVPLDPAYPRSRLAFLLEDSGAGLLVTRSPLLERLPTAIAARVPALLLDGERPADGLPESNRRESVDGLAYVIYTSGSTGRPKGVGIGHRSAAAFVAWAGGVFRAEELAGVLAATSVCFDLSIFEIFAPLSHGGALVLAEDALALPRLPAAGRVTLVNTVPSAMAELVEHGGLPASVRVVNLAGEPLPGPLADRIYAAGHVERVLNLYGPSEDTTYSTWALAEPGGHNPPIGRPIAGTRAHVLDPRGEPVPAGVPGELLLGGAGLARGYLGRPEATAERFVPDPFSGLAGERLYRTGDLARWRPDGQLDFLGRIDHQVKVRGFRVELGEIEARLLEHPGSREAVVLALGGQLIAFVAAGEPAPTGAELRAHLAETLPASLVPSAFAVLPELPHTPTGKVDRRALARFSPEAETGAAYAAPRTPAEEVLAAVWAGVLGRERIGIDEDFFELGGHSLAAARVASRARAALAADLQPGDLFTHPTVVALARRAEELRAAAAFDQPPLERLPRTGAAPLSFAQERLWFLDRMTPEDSAYNIAQAVLLRGPLDAAALRRALTGVVRRHEALRTTIVLAEDAPGQAIGPAPDGVPLPCVDLSGLGEAAHGLVAALAREEAARPFDLERGPLLRARLLRLAAEEHAVLLTLHHIVADGWSLGVLVAELAALYGGGRGGGELPELPVQYADFAAWQRRWLSGETLERELALWRRRLEGAPAAIELPADRPRPTALVSHGGSRGGVWSFALPAATAAALGRLARRQGATPFQALLAGFQALLARCGAGEDISVGTPVAGRTRPETEGLIGLFVNTLVMRGDLAGDPPFAELLRRTRDAALEAYAHQDLPFERLVEELRPERGLAATPLFQVLLVLQNAPLDLHLPGLTLTPLPVDSGRVKFDLALSLTELTEMDGGLAGALSYRSDLFDRATAARLAGQLAVLLERAAAEPERPLSTLPLLGEAARHQVAVEWADGPAPRRERRPLLHERFFDWAERVPDAPAVAGEGETATYAELRSRAERLAWHLRSLGVGPDVPVGVCLERSPDLIAAILGIHAAGGAYVPLDPAHPAERLAWTLADSGAPLVVTRAALLPGLGGTGAEAGLNPVLLDRAATWRDPREDFFPAVPDSALAYILYTSGSTGRPKGVAVEHRHLRSYVDAVLERLRPPAGAVFASVSTIAADLGNTMVFPALATGGCLSLAALERAQDAAALAEDFARLPPDYLKIVPSHLAALLAGPEPARLLPRRALVLGGEALPRDLADRLERLAPRMRRINHYGPTETTVGVLTQEVNGSIGGMGGVSVPLGRPLAGVSARVLDAAMAPVPPGVTGELWIGGASVARGYLGRPDATAERFRPDPFGAPGGRLYRTGDRARFRVDGAVEFLGRTDDQLKVRGFRIEPAEVEAALAAHPAVREAVAGVVERAGDRRLAAWVVPAGETPRTAELLAFLAGRLPGPMVPSEILFLDSLPLTLNGKVDRAALAAAPPFTEAAETGLQTGIEELLAGIWSELLGVRPGRGDSFFDLGGHSLLATRLAGRLRAACGVELPLRALFEAPTLEAMARRVEAALRDGAVPEAPPLGRSALAAAPLSFAQERLWFLERLDPGTALYNLAYHARVQGPLDAATLERALRHTVRRHEPLRTAFPASAGAPAPVVLDDAPPPFLVADLAGLPAEIREGEAQRIAEAEAGRPFDLERAPLVRCVLVQLGGDDHRLLLTLHHLVSDAWSRGVLLRDLAAAYARIEPDTESAPLPVRYGDWAAWQRSWLHGPALASRMAYWRERLAGAPAALDLPADRPRAAVPRYRGARSPFELPREASEALAALARREGATPFMALLAGLQTLLHRYTGEEDVVVGTPVAGRAAGTEDLVGFFVNTLALRVGLAGNPSFTALLARARESALGAYAHQDLPFEKLVEELAPRRDRSRSPLFQVMLAFQNVPMPPLRLGTAMLSPLEVDNGTAKFDWTLYAVETPEGIAGWLEYDRDLFDAGTAARALGHLGTLLGAAAAAPDVSLAELPLLTAPERRQLLDWNDTGAALGGEALLHELFEAQADRTPDAVAVECEDERLTYRELDERANRLAAALREDGRKDGVLPESPVGVCLERSLEMVVSLLAVLKAGGAYVPLDPSYPRERLAYMVEQAGAPVVLVQERFVGVLPGKARRIAVDRASFDGYPARRLDGVVGPDNLAYAIFTSGSTGRPKGAMNTHRGIVNRLLWLQASHPLTGEDAVLQKTPFSFDVSVWELFWPLVAGARLVMARPGGHQDPLYLRDTIARRGITTLHFVPSMLHVFLDAPGLEEAWGARRVLCSGEALAPELRERFFARLGGELHNLYGPTEAAVEVTHHVCAPGTPLRIVPIGRPVAGTRIHLLDREMRPVPAGVPARLYIAGVQLARGYLGRPDLTAERFVPDPAGAPGDRLYDTGDLARWRTEGEIEFLGRVDHQVKIRGFRIEPQEVEAALAAHPAVREAVVLARRDALGEARLVAYWVASGEAAPASAELRSFLARSLPPFLVPASFVRLAELPLLPNGKLDRQALPAPDARSEARDLVPPRTPVEETLARLWAELLGVERVGVHDDFFELGGHSLLATRMLFQASEALGVELPVAGLFERPTVAALAEVAERARAKTEAVPGPVRRAARGGRGLDGLLEALE